MSLFDERNDIHEHLINYNFLKNVTKCVFFFLKKISASVNAKQDGRSIWEDVVHIRTALKARLPLFSSVSLR